MDADLYLPNATFYRLALPRMTSDVSRQRKTPTSSSMGSMCSEGLLLQAALRLRRCHPSGLAY